MHGTGRISGRVSAVVVAWIGVVVLAAAPAGAQTTYQIFQESSYFGWLDQYSLDNSTYHFVGNEACVPTSSTNAMTYLQNLAPTMFGTALTGTTYADWIATDAILISPPYMNTTPVDGTYSDHVYYGLNKYIRQDKGFTQVQISGMMPADYWGAPPYDKPASFTDGKPTADFLMDSLLATNATLFTIEYAGGGGHGLLASGFDWTDTNNDGIIQPSENAALYFVDPLDPATYDISGQPVAGPKMTQGHIWQNISNGFLEMVYTQYQGSLPYNASNYASTGTVKIDTMYSIAVPEPGTLVLLGAGGLMVLRRRRGASGNAARASNPAVAAAA